MLKKLEEIRKSDPATKLRWLIILSAISLVFVLAIWFLSINMIIANVNMVASPEVASQEGFFTAFKERAKELGDRTGAALGNLKGSIRSKEIQLSPATSTK